MCITLHYGSGIDVGHYTAVIFKDGRVYEVDDTFVSDISQKWKQKVSTYAYIAFYSAENFSDKGYGDERQSSTQLSDDSDNEDIPRSTSSPNFVGSVHSTSAPTAQTNSRDVQSKVDSLPPSIAQKYKKMCKVFHSLCDLNVRNERVASFKTHGYNLLGKDIKTLEPLEKGFSNDTYVLSNPGWLNDEVINCYLLLLRKNTEKFGLRSFAFTTQFMTKLRSVRQLNNKERFHEMLRRHYRGVLFHLYDVIAIPMNVGKGSHWCMAIINTVECFVRPNCKRQSISNIGR